MLCLSLARWKVNRLVVSALVISPSLSDRFSFRSVVIIGVVVAVVVPVVVGMLGVFVAVVIAVGLSLKPEEKNEDIVQRWLRFDFGVRGIIVR